MVQTHRQALAASQVCPVAISTKEEPQKTDISQIVNTSFNMIIGENGQRKPCGLLI